MALLDIVDEHDRIVGKADFVEAHERGLRHRSVQVFVFRNLDYMEFNRKYERMKNCELLIVQRSRKQEVSALKLGPSVGGHVKKGQSYIDAAREELREELFHGSNKLLNAIQLSKVASFKNDTRKTNKENSVLFATSYTGPFFPDPKEIEIIYWKSSWEIFDDMNKNPKDYTQTFITSMKNYLFID